MNTIDRKIKELKIALQREQWQSIDVCIVGAVSIKVLLNKPQYKYLESNRCIQLCDTIDNKIITIDIETAREIIGGRNSKRYKIVLDNSECIVLKIH